MNWFEMGAHRGVQRQQPEVMVHDQTRKSEIGYTRSTATGPGWGSRMGDQLVAPRPIERADGEGRADQRAGGRRKRDEPRERHGLFQGRP